MIANSEPHEEYGEKYQDHFLEQYKLFVETSQHVTEKRQTANNYLLTLCSALTLATLLLRIRLPPMERPYPSCRTRCCLHSAVNGQLVQGSQYCEVQSVTSGRTASVVFVPQ